MTAEFVHCAYDGGAATLTLDRAPDNLMSIEMMEQLNTTLLELRDHPELKVLVIRGNGDFFCGGVDFIDHTRERVGRLVQVFHRIFETLRLLDVIAVAAVNGRAVGGGFELAIGCNLVLASESSRLASPRSIWAHFPCWRAWCFLEPSRDAKPWSGSSPAMKSQRVNSSDSVW